MNTREVFSAEGTAHLNKPEEFERHRINVLQIAWFEHMCKRYSDEDVDTLLDRIIESGVTDARKKMIENADREMKRDILLQEMIAPGNASNVPDGLEERRWFREEFLDFEQFPDHKEMLRRFAEKPEEAEQVLSDLDDIFRENVTRH